MRLGVLLLSVAAAHCVHATDITCDVFSELRGAEAFAPVNVARKPGAVAFAQDGLTNWFPFHRVENLIDGVYGNDSAWVAQRQDSFCGVLFASLTSVSGIAFGRDATGALADRSAGAYTLQYTSAPNPLNPTSLPEWQTIGTVTNSSTVHAGRRRFCFPTVNATAIRLLVSTTEPHPADGAIAIDELEVFEHVLPVMIDVAAEVRFEKKAGRLFQLQSSTDLKTWSNVGGTIVGDGQVYNELLSTRSTPRRYFRVQDVTP